MGLEIVELEAVRVLLQLLAHDHQVAVGQS